MLALGVLWELSRKRLQEVIGTILWLKPVKQRSELWWFGKSLLISLLLLWWVHLYMWFGVSLLQLSIYYLCFIYYVNYNVKRFFSGLVCLVLQIFVPRWYKNLYNFFLLDLGYFFCNFDKILPLLLAWKFPSSMSMNHRFGFFIVFHRYWMFCL